MSNFSKFMKANKIQKENVMHPVTTSLLDEKGKLHMEWADLCVSMHGAYYSVGKFLGKLGCSTDKKGGKNG